jgi:PHD/YefM family antitoxin component YafN of YafNO toxin-antitoxin module
MTRESADRVLRDADATLGKLRRGRAVVLERKGRERAVLLSARRFRRILEDLEDQLDANDAERAILEAEARGEKPIPLEQIKRELGME